jgi:hypothetical protein
MLDGKARSLPLSGALERLEKNIIIGWKGLPGTNTLVYCKHP